MNTIGTIRAIVYPVNLDKSSSSDHSGVTNN